MEAHIFARVAQRYLNRKTKFGNGKSGTATLVLKQMSNRWKGRSIRDISKADITEMVEDLEARKLANATINNYLKYLKAVMNYAADELELMESTPKIKMLRENERELFLEPEQVKRLLRFLDPLRADLVEFALNVGQRNTNVRLLRWDQLTQGLDFIRYKGSETKNGKPQLIPLNGDAQSILRKRVHLREELELSRPRLVGQIDHVFFQEDGKPFHRTSLVNDSWRRAVKNAGLPKGTSFHTLRHTFASWHIRAGTDIRELMELGGWSSFNSMKRYTHLSNEHRKSAASRIEGMVLR